MIKQRAVVAVGALAIATLTGCARVQAADGAAPAGADVYAGIKAQLFGTPAQRQAGDERQFYAWQAAMGTCMTGKGYEFDLINYVDVGAGAGEPSPGDMLAWSAHFTDFGITARAQRDAQAGSRDNPALLRLSGDAAHAWIAAQAGCTDATKDTENLAMADGSEALEENLITELATLQDELAPDLATQYSACMSTAGVDATALDAAMVLVYQRVAQGLDGAQAYEEQIAATDWQCRGHEATRVVDASGEQLTTWTGQHADELAAVAAAWADMPDARDTALAAAQAATS